MASFYIVLLRYLFSYVFGASSVCPQVLSSGEIRAGDLKNASLRQPPHATNQSSTNCSMGRKLITDESKNEPMQVLLEGAREYEKKRPSRKEKRRRIGRGVRCSRKQHLRCLLFFLLLLHHLCSSLRAYKGEVCDCCPCTKGIVAADVRGHIRRRLLAHHARDENEIVLW